MPNCLTLKKSNCKNCYKCIRHCPVKSIRFSGNQAHIIGNECILCGHCFVVCPQNAKEIVDETEKVKVLIQSGDPVVASLAPSFVANYEGVGIEAMREALKKLGFYDVEETALGATLVKREYDRILMEEDRDVVISSCCHSINLLIQKYFPRVLPYLADVLSPMQAHCEDIKRRIPNAKTVFIGPCVAKKDEAEYYEGMVDAVLTYEELTNWLKKKGIEIQRQQQPDEHSLARFFPTTGGILKTMAMDAPNFSYLALDGVENCIAALKEIEQGKIHHCFIEMSACVGSCAGGPVMEKYGHSPLKDYLAVAGYAGDKDFEIEQPETRELRKRFEPIDQRAMMPSETEIRDILREMGKFKPSQELNCGSCGYNTCREKAMHKFDTKVQYLKYKVLREVARQAWNDTLLDNVLDIPKMIVPGKVPTMRCCVYKERAILAERVKLAMGGGNNANIINVIDIACDDCPAVGYQVTDSCRGCLAHRCEGACRRGAISFDHNHEAHIDKTKCVECGQCAKVCPYSAIVNRKRPCQNACKIKAISINEDNAAKIDDEKCIQCGACVYQCPFGAISDRSFIINVIDMLKKSQGNTKYKVYALVAPAIGSQLNYAKLGQVITGIKELGFYTVVEAALGADMVAQAESKELSEKDFLTSSCCPAFVRYVKTAFPALVPYISHNLSPMATIAKYIKDHDQNVKIVFIGPCTAKKAEVQLDDVKPYVDAAITFEELQALLDSRDIDITSLSEDVLDNASYFGRIFARSGGLSDAIAEGLKEQHLDDFQLKACACDGIEECRIALLKKSRNVLDANFIEGMACVNGCIGGAGNLTHGEKNKAAVDSYGREALEKTILDAIAPL